MLKIPQSLEEEHEDIMRSMKLYSTNLDGNTGRALNELLEVLKPHFQKENQLAMPVLGSLKALSQSIVVPNLQEISTTFAPLQAEYEKMLNEHLQIGKLISEALKQAKLERRSEVIDLLEGLAHHARIEEEVLYPAALVAGLFARNLMLQNISV